MTREPDDLPPRSVAEEADYLGVSENTLTAWRYQGKGPRWVKVGRHVRYPRRDTQDWLDAGADSPKQARDESLTSAPAPKRTRRSKPQTSRARR
jgi:hypothetical protein